MLKQTIMDYHSYIKSDTWRAVRTRKLQSCGYACEACGDKNHMHIHHLTYERLGDEPDCDLMALCESCHHLSHALWRKMPKMEVRHVRICLRHFLLYCKAHNAQRAISKKRSRANRNHNTLPQAVKVFLSRSKKEWRNNGSVTTW